MRCLHLVRVGALGHVGRFSAADGTIYPRATRVVVRTARGVEVGEVLAPPASSDAQADSDGPLIRALTVEDELLLARTAKNRDAAYEACQSRLEELELPVSLMDVEHLLDGQTLVFYFLGPPTPELEPLVAELTELYDAKVQFRSFVAAATAGCGPGCGTESATGCGSCSTGCAIAGACSSRKAAAAS